MRIRVDRDKCITAASCVAILPKIFKLDDEGKAVIVKKTGEDGEEWVDYIEIDADEEDLIAAAESCPTMAIIIEDDNGKQVYP